MDDNKKRLMRASNNKIRLWGNLNAREAARVPAYGSGVPDGVFCTACTRDAPLR